MRILPTKRSIPALEDLPKSLRMAMARVMTEFNLDYPEALERASLLIDVNCRAFKREVEREAERRHKSRFMTEVNKARATIEKDFQVRLNNAYKNWEAAGYNRAMKEYAIWYNCSVCGQPIYIIPNSEIHKIVNDHIRSQGWGHKECHDRRAKGVI